MNNRGDIIGYSYKRRSPFLIRDGKEIDLTNATGGRLVSVSDINNLGQVCGMFLDGSGSRPARWSNGNLVTLDVPAQYSGGEATSINDASQMVGVFQKDGGNSRAFFFSDGNVTLLGSADKPGYATGLSENGQVVYKSGDEWFRWTKDGEYPLEAFTGPIVGGAEVVLSTINNRGHVLGYWGYGNAGLLWTEDSVSEVKDLLSPYYRYDHFSQPRVFNFNEQGVISAATDHGNVMLLWPVRDGVARPRILLEGSHRRVTDRGRIVLRGTTRGDTVSVIASTSGLDCIFAEGTGNWRLELPSRPGRTIYRITAHGRGGDSQPMTVTVLRR